MTTWAPDFWTALRPAAPADRRPVDATSHDSAPGGTRASIAGSITAIGSTAKTRAQRGATRMPQIWTVGPQVSRSRRSLCRATSDSTGKKPSCSLIARIHTAWSSLPLWTERSHSGRERREGWQSSQQRPGAFPGAPRYQRSFDLSRAVNIDCRNQAGPGDHDAVTVGCDGLERRATLLLAKPDLRFVLLRRDRGGLPLQQAVGCLGATIPLSTPTCARR